MNNDSITNLQCPHTIPKTGRRVMEDKSMVVEPEGEGLKNQVCMKKEGHSRSKQYSQTQ